MSKPKFSKLAAQFPGVFAMRSKDRRPLAIGIQDELLKVDTGLSANQLRNAMASYCTSIGYLRQMLEGAARIGLDGRPAGVVTAAEAEDAAKRLAEHMTGTAKRPPQKPVDAASEPVQTPRLKPAGASKSVVAPPQRTQRPVGASKPVQAPPLKPVEAPIVPVPVESAPVAPEIAKRRHGLADLRAAAARRRQDAEAS